MRNFKVAIVDAVAPVIADDTDLTAEEHAARQLGVGYELARIAEDTKKKAKKALTKLGILRDDWEAGKERILDTAHFVLERKTSEPALRLSEVALLAALDAEPRMTAPMKARIMAAAFVEAKPATTFKVEQR